MKIVFIADAFAEQVLGGGELNNEELLKMLAQDGHDVLKINSHKVTPEFIDRHIESKFIIANFANLKPALRDKICDTAYIIYEHDHKYLNTRNPGEYPGFKAPKEEIVNIELYKNARAVLCQSQFHLEIIKMNTELDNLINLSGNLWSLRSLDLMKAMAEKPKSECCSIMQSNIIHKNTREAIMYCKHKKMPYKLVSSKNYESFLDQLSENKTLLFLPKTPETLSRVVVEARMMGMSVIVNKMIGATREPWYELKGKDLIEYMRVKRKMIKDVVLEELS